MNAVLPIGRHGSVWALLAAVVVTTSIACTSSDGGGVESAPSCAALAKYRNQTYAGTEAGDFTVGNELGTATVPPCNDSPNYDGPTTPTSTTAYAIKGVDPGIAIALGEAPDDVIFVNLNSGKKLPEIKKLINGS